MLQRFRESLSLILVAVLPIHALLVTMTTHMLQGQHHAPLVIIALWKEVLLAVLVVLVLIEIVRMKESELQHSVWKLDMLDWSIVLAVALGITVSLLHGAGSSFGHLSLVDKQFLFGFKYDFLPLVVFLFLRRVPWSRNFMVVAARTIVMIGIVAALFGILTLFLPLEFFTSIGYSDLHSLYLPNAAIASFQFLEGTQIRRIQSFMSGPNQFGLWLLLPLAANLLLFVKSFREHRRMDSFLYVGGEILIITALFLTYSRSAWIGAAVIVCIFFILLLRHYLASVFRRTLVVAGVCLLTCFAIVVGVYVSPHILVRTQSFKGHVEKPLAALQIIRAHPFGLGLGTAGPASNRLSDACVFFDIGADFSWAANHKNFCVFIGGIQKLPADNACDCPLLTENWYVQWGVEMGIAGLFLSLAIVVIVLVYGFRFPTNDLRMVPVLAFLGVAVGGIFLHAFEDGAVAYSLWLLLSASRLTLEPETSGS